MYMTVNARWRNRRYRSGAAVHVPNFQHSRSPPCQSCRSRMQKNNPFRNMTTKLNRERQLWTGTRCRNPVCERQLWSGNVGFVTWRLPSYIHYVYTVHTSIYIHLMLYMPSICHTEKPSCIYMFIYYIYIYYIITYISYIVYLYIYIYIYAFY